MGADGSWACDAVIYEIYIRSFADSDNDGVGDLRGIVSRLDYLVELGVDAVWLTPFYPSPMADGGYDVADYRDIDPSLGTLAEFDTLLTQAHSRGLKVIVDLVPNHCSEAHPWFRAALAAGPGSPERSRFHFANGHRPPNNWQSIFRGPAWTQVADGEWYLHLFAPQQPDFNWDNPQVRAEFADVLRFWLDRGVDGVRIDVAHGLVKAHGLPDMDAGPTPLASDPAPFFDQDAVHDIYRHWRAILDTYAPQRIAVAEAWLPTVVRTARYVRADELHQAFNFEFLTAPWSGPGYRRVIDAALAAMGSVGAPATWVMSNHDVTRPATRLATGAGGRAGGGAVDAGDPALGRRRARAAALLMLALPGAAYLYQGEELGLPEVLDLPAAARQDPIFARTGGAELGRDGCRVPLPWSGTEPPYGFGPTSGQPWLPQPPGWAELSVQVQSGDATSTLSLYRRALRLRREVAALGGGVLSWHSNPDADVLVFSRPGPDGTGVRCAVNLGSTPVPSPSRSPALVASDPGVGDELPPDTAGWWPLD